MRGEQDVTSVEHGGAAAPPLLREYLDATRSSLWVLDPHRLERLRACVDDARRWGELESLERFWADHRIAEDRAIELNWFSATLHEPLTPEPPILLACACTGEPLEATQQHAALPVGRIDPLFDPARPAYHRWVDRQLDLEWHASFLRARDVLRQLPSRLDQRCRASLAEWLHARARAAGAASSAVDAAGLFEAWARRYVEHWRGLVVAELEPLAARDALLVVFVDD